MPRGDLYYSNGNFDATLSEKWPIREAPGSCPNKRLTERSSFYNLVEPILTAGEISASHAPIRRQLGRITKRQTFEERQGLDLSTVQFCRSTQIEFHVTSWLVPRAPTFPFPRELTRTLASSYSTCHVEVRKDKFSDAKREKKKRIISRFFATLHRDLMQFCHFIWIAR